MAAPLSSVIYWHTRLTTVYMHCKFMPMTTEAAKLHVSIKERYNPESLWSGWRLIGWIQMLISDQQQPFLCCTGLRWQCACKHPEDSITNALYWLEIFKVSCIPNLSALDWMPWSVQNLPRSPWGTFGSLVFGHIHTGYCSCCCVLTVWYALLRAAHPLHTVEMPWKVGKYLVLCDVSELFEADNYIPIVNWSAGAGI